MENIVFGYNFDRSRYERVLKACALGQDFWLLPDGDQTLASAGGASLSGGQKWQVALARALYSPAEILILEGVNGAVDAPVAAWICENALTGDMARGRPVILATHRPEFCSEAASYLVTVQGGAATGRLQTPKPLENQT